MYTPVALGGAMTIAGIWGAFSKRAARTVLRWTSAFTLLDGLIGFIFTFAASTETGRLANPGPNMIMGPPIFAPILFGVSAYLGLVASFLRPEEAPPIILRSPKARLLSLTSEDLAQQHPWTMGLREGRFQKHLAMATIVGTFCSGAEALYSHYKNNFRYIAQWTPIIIAPLLMGAAAGAMVSPKVARTWLPAMSVLAIADGGVGFFYHARGVIRRPAGYEETALQHHLRSADFRAAPLRGLRLDRSARESDAEGTLMAPNEKLPIDPGTLRAARRPMAPASRFSGARRAVRRERTALPSVFAPLLAVL